MSEEKNNLSNDELAVLAANGDDEAMARLIFVVTPIVEARALNLSDGSVPIADLVQEGMIGFLNAVKSFDTSKEAAFNTYVRICIDNQIRSVIRKSNNEKNVAITKAVPVEPNEKELGKDSDPADIVLAKLSAEHIFKLIDDELTELERMATRLRIYGLSISQTAKVLECNEKSVDNALQRAKKKLSEKLQGF